jgi:hypothetical protein
LIADVKEDWVMAAVVVGVVGTRATVIDTVKFDGFDIVR